MLIKILLFLFLVTPVFADNPPERIYDEGVLRGTAFNLNCVGAGISCTQSGVTGTITVSGGGGASTWDAITSPVGNQTLDHNTYTTTWNNVGKFSFSGLNVGIGSTSPTQTLDVVGTVKMNAFKMATGASNAYVLTSDASGNGAWTAASGGALTLVATATPSAAANFTISSLAANTFYHLEFFYTQNTADGFPKINFNGDTGANYAWVNQFWLASSGGTNSSGAGYCGLSANANITAGGKQFFVFDFTTDSAGTNTYLLGKENINVASNGLYNWDSVCIYAGASSLTSLTFTNTAGTMTGTAKLYAYN